MIAVIDYGAGNIRSVEKALMHIGCEVEVTQDPSVLMKADGAVLPGVGSFGDAMHELRGRELEAPIKAFVASGKPFLGICLGLQILFESSEESPGVLRERVTSKGGTTEAALKSFAADGFPAIVERAVKAAEARGRELGDQLGRD